MVLRLARANKWREAVTAHYMDARQNKDGCQDDGFFSKQTRVLDRCLRAGNDTRWQSTNGRTRSKIKAHNNHYSSALDGYRYRVGMGFKQVVLFKTLKHFIHKRSKKHRQIL